MTRRPPFDRDDSAEHESADAADWVVRAHSDQRTSDDDQALREWLAASPENAAEFRIVRTLWDEIGDLRDDAQVQGALRNISEPAAPAPLFTRRRIMTAGGAAALAAAASVGLIAILPRRGEVYETIVGEQRRIQLEEGSSVTLNTDTRLRIRFSESERWLELEQGQAWFQVAHDPSRPFRVIAGNDEVRALGTAFEVRRIGDHARVVLEQGIVAVYRGSEARPLDPEGQSHAAGTRSSRRPDAILRPGQAALVDDGRQIAARQVDLAREQAWRFGRIILDEEPLADAVAEINRYGRKQIEIADPRLASYRVSGVFHTARPEIFVDAVTQAFPIAAEFTTDERIVLTSR